MTEPSVNDLTPIVPPGRPAEPMLLLDTTGSMSYPNTENSKVQRREVIGEALGRLVETLGQRDSQAAAEQAAGRDAGGLMAITFAGGLATCLEDLSPANWHDKFQKIEWGGGTQIMPGWRLLLETYLGEFGDKPIEIRPNLLALVLTDGEADDSELFAETLAQSPPGIYAAIAMLGYGAEHDRAFNTYQNIAAANNQRVRAVTFGGSDDPDMIANSLLTLIGI